VGSALNSDTFNEGFRGGLVFKAHRPVYHSTLGLRAIEKKTFNEGVVVIHHDLGDVLGHGGGDPEDRVEEEELPVQPPPDVRCLRFRGGLVFKAHRLVYHSTLGLRYKKRREDSRPAPPTKFIRCPEKRENLGLIDSGLVERGAARAEDAQGTPNQSHISPSILVYKDYRAKSIQKNFEKRVEEAQLPVQPSPGVRHLFQGSGFRVQGSDFRVQGSGFRIQDVCLWGLRLSIHPPPDFRCLRHEYDMLDTDQRAKSWMSRSESIHPAGCYCVACRSTLRNSGVVHTSTPFGIPELGSCRLYRGTSLIRKHPPP